MKKLPISFLYILVFLSGGVAILYETIWFHNLTLIMGSTSLALTLILTSFMLGLGLGSLFWGNLADKKNPRKTYQLLELGIGVFAFLSLFLFSPINYLYQILYDLFYLKPILLSFFRFLLSMLILLPPTLFMGGTLPVAVKYLVREIEKKGKNISAFYWVNTFGASIMALFVPIYLMLWFDMKTLIILGGMTNFLIAFLIFFLPPYKRIEVKEKEYVKEEKTSIFPFIAFFLSGTSSLAIETLWNRHLILIFGGSVYTFGLILSIFLLGIVLGSIFFSYLKISERGSLVLFYISIIFSSVFLSLSLFLFPKISFYQLKLLSKFELTFLNYNLVNLFLIFLFVFPITFFFGIAFPSALNGLTKNIESLGKKAGFLMAINSLGTALGPIILSFFILPFFNFQLSYKIIVFLLLFSSFFMAIYLKEKLIKFSFFFLPIILIILIPKWETINFLLGTPKSPQFALEMFKKTGGKVNLSPLKILWEKTDYEAHTTVILNPDKTKVLVINGKADASDGLDMYTQSLSGHIPFLFGRKIENVLLIGLGSGVTTHCVLTHPISEIKSIEISPAVVEAAKNYFSNVNYLCFNDNRSKIIESDGRAELSLSKEKYDLIISEPSNPWLKGVASLFTYEFFKISKEKLKEGGILCQWLNLYNLSLQNILNVLNTLKAVFPQILCFYNKESNDLLFIASSLPFQLNINSLEDFPDKAKEQIISIGIKNLDKILERFLWNLEELSFKVTMPLNKDTYPWLELLAPKDVFQYKIEENVMGIIKLNLQSKIPISLKNYEKNNLLKNNIKILKEFSSSAFEAYLISRAFFPYGKEYLFKRKVGIYSKNNEIEVYSFYQENENFDYFIKQFYEGVYYELKGENISGEEFILVQASKSFYIKKENGIINLIFLKKENL